MSRHIDLEQKNNAKKEIAKLKKKLSKVDEQIDFLHKFATKEKTIGKEIYGIKQIALDRDSFLDKSRSAEQQYMNEVHDSFRTIGVDGLEVGTKAIENGVTKMKYHTFREAERMFDKNILTEKFKIGRGEMPILTTPTAPYIFYGNGYSLKDFIGSEDSLKMEMRNHNTITLGGESINYHIPRLNEGNFRPFASVIYKSNIDGTKTLERICMKTFIHIGSESINGLRNIVDSDLFGDKVEINFPKILLFDYLKRSRSLMNISNTDIYAFDFTIRIITMLDSVKYEHTALPENIKSVLQFKGYDYVHYKPFGSYGNNTSTSYMEYVYELLVGEVRYELTLDVYENDTKSLDGETVKNQVLGYIKMDKIQ